MADRTYDTFIFDLDGTLLDTLPDLVFMTNSALEDQGYPPRTTDEVHSFVGNGVKALIAQSVPEGTDEASVEKTMERWKDLYLTYDNPLTKAYPGIPELIDDLHGRHCRLGVVSNKLDDGVTQIMNLRLPGAFAVMHGESEGYPRKPDPTSVLKTIKELDSDPSRTVYVGDSPTDVKTARNAGVYSVAVAWGYHDEKDFTYPGCEPDLLIHHPLELLQLATSEAEYTAVD